MLLMQQVKMHLVPAMATTAQTYVMGITAAAIVLAKAVLIIVWEDSASHAHMEITVSMYALVFPVNLAVMETTAMRLAQVTVA